MDPATRFRLGELIGTAVTTAHSLGGQHDVRHYRLALADGRSAFAKVGNGLDRPGPAGRAAAVPPGEPDAAAGSRASARSSGAVGFAAEAAGLNWLAEAAATGVPAVLASDGDCLVIEWIEAGQPSRDAAARFGRELRVCMRPEPIGSARRGPA